MARINIEDSLYRDNRFINLYIKLNSFEAAIGALVRVWSVAQDWYLTENKMIPVGEWKKQGLNDAVIEVGLAEITDGFIRVSGADKQFSWLYQKVEAGRRGGLAKSKKNSDVAGAKRTLAGAKRDVAVPYPLTLTPSLTLTLKETHTHTPDKLNTGSRTEDQLAHEECVSIWGETLQALGINKDPKFDEMTIARLIQKYGSTRVWHMLRGQRWETGGPDWDVRKHLSAMKILNDQAKAEKLENLSLLKETGPKQKSKYADEVGQ